MKDNISDDLRALRRHRSKVCPYNKNWRRYSRRQYEAHFTSKYYIPRELSANENAFESQYDDTYTDDFHDTNATSTIDFLPSSQSTQRETLLTSSSNNLTFTERNFHFWKLTDGYTLSREAMRNLVEIISHKDFHNFQVPTEYRMNEIDLEFRQRIFPLSEAIIDNKPVAYLSITNSISGMLTSKSFRLSVLTSNGYNCDDRLYQRLYLRTNFTEISGQAKFKSLLVSRNIDTLLISLVVFSDDFGKDKRSK